MNTIQPNNNKSFLGNIFRGARDGAERDAIFGLGLTVMHQIRSREERWNEEHYRRLGGLPRMPINESDCQLPQFKETSFCTQQTSALIGSICFIGITTLLGMTIGAVVGACNSIAN